MRNRIFFTVLMYSCCSVVSASNIKYTVEPDSKIERELDYQLTVIDKFDSWRKYDKNIAKGPSSEYSVKFRASATGRLKDIFSLSLTVVNKGGLVVQAPLRMRSKYKLNDDIIVEFFINKSLIGDSILILRCGSPLQETSYSVNLGRYVSPKAP